MKYKKIISLIPVIIIMIAIFMFSSQTGEESSEVSGFLSTKIKEILNYFREYTFFENLEHIIRKSAHFIIYMSLGFFLSIHLKFYSLSDKLQKTVPLIICFLYAISDEFHQLFVPERSGQIKDVFIDTSGAFIGIVIFYILNKLITKKTEDK